MANAALPGQRGFGGKGGRKPGTPNKLTLEVRAAFSSFYGKVSERELLALWRRAKKKDPVKALQLFVTLCEYFVPKLSRIENTGKDGGPQVVEVRTYPVAPPEPRLTNDAAVLREREADEE